MAAETIQLLDPVQTRRAVQRAGEALAAGGLVIFPTETVYGVGAWAGSDKGYEALREVKGRPVDQPFTIHLPDPGSAQRYIDVSNQRLNRLLDKVFPGPVTMVVDVEEEVIHQRLRALNLPPESRDRIYHHNTVGLRCPDHPLAQQILASIDGPIVASSANRRGQRPPHDAAEATAALGAEVDVVIDGGRCRYAKPSTIVRVRGVGDATKITVEREGVYDERFIRKLMRWTMLIVCTGNTCRSPMAEGMAKQLLSQERGINTEDLEAAGLRVISAGVATGGGQPANPEAVAAMSRIGVDLARHRSRPLTRELIHEADVIYVMTQDHIEAVAALSETARSKTHLLDPGGEIEDPIGMGATAYQRSAEVIRRRLAQRIKEQQP